MKNQEIKKLQQLATGVGHFIRYWGFRKIHGEIWAVVYLTKVPMSGIEIGRLLKVSKALISPAIKELEAEGLVRKAKSENSKTKRYQAEENIAKIVQRVLSRREKPMLEEMEHKHIELSRLSSENPSLDTERLQKMGKMIHLAQMALNTLIDTDNLLDV